MRITTCNTRNPVKGEASRQVSYGSRGGHACQPPRPATRHPPTVAAKPGFESLGLLLSYNLEPWHIGQTLPERAGWGE